MSTSGRKKIASDYINSAKQPSKLEHQVHANAYALRDAILDDNNSAVKEMLDMKVNPNVGTETEERYIYAPPISFAARRGNIAIAEMLLKHGAKITPTEDRFTGASLLNVVNTKFTRR